MVISREQKIREALAMSLEEREKKKSDALARIGIIAKEFSCDGLFITQSALTEICEIVDEANIV